MNILLSIWAYYKQNFINFHSRNRKVYLTFYYENEVALSIAETKGEPIIYEDSVCAKKGFEY